MPQPDPNEAPAIILSEPQLGENIGAAARAMANFGLSDLRLVRPRDGWPNPKAEAMAAGAADILAAVQIFATVEEAVAELNYVLATTARDRSMPKAIVTPSEGAARLKRAVSRGKASAVLFGGERSGLTNHEVALADEIISIPTAGFSSLNLGQAVMLIGYEWFKAGDATPSETIDHGGGLPVPREELFNLFEHLEDELEKGGFLHPPGTRPGTVRNLRSLLHRAQLTDQEVRTLRGVIVALTKGKKRTAMPENKEK